jgi:protein TonB
MISDISFPTATSGLLILLVALFVIGIIIFFRTRFNAASNSNLAEKYADTDWGSPLAARAKYPDVNAFKLRTPFLLYGIVAALAAIIFAFSATSYEDEVFIPDDALELDEDFLVEPPRTAEPPPPPPPPPPPVIEEVPEEEIEDEEEPIFEDTEVDEETVVEDAPIVEDEAPPPPPPPPPPPAEEEIFKVVEQMPRFPGCENSGGSNEEKAKCAEGELLQYIYKNLKYPAIARENGVEGTCVIQFVVDKDGSVQNVKLARDIGAGCGEAAKKVVENMNNMSEKWTPGKQRGRAVKVYYTLPIRFKLEG